MSTTDIHQEYEFLLYTMTTGVGYWAHLVGTPDSLTVTEREQTSNEVKITHEVLAAFFASDGPQKLIKQLGDPYHKDAIRAMVLGDWDDVDYDAETADVIAQQIVHHVSIVVACLQN